MNPTKITNKKKDQFVELLVGGHSIGTACKMLDVSRTSMFFARKKDPEFETRVQEARDTVVEVVEEALFSSAINKNNVTAQIFILCNRCPERWKSVNRSEIKVMNADEELKKAISLVGNLSENEIDRLEQDSQSKKTQLYALPQLLPSG